MIVGSPTPATTSKAFYWQMYEISGLEAGKPAVVRKIPNQPANYNNVSPFYGTDERVLFTSDRPRSGQPHLYPNLDEYESTPAVSGIWGLDPSSGELELLNHTPSGAFSPFIDSFGRIVFTRWDHLQRDQQRDAGDKGAYNLSDESSAAVPTGADTEVFPEPRLTVTTTPYGAVNGNRNNLFTPWQMNEDGMEEETLNHIGRHELAPGGFLQRTFVNDPSLSDNAPLSATANRKTVTMDGGVFHLKEDPLRPGTYLGILAREFGSLTTNQIVSLAGAPNLAADKMTISDVTIGNLDSAGSLGGRFRNPLPLTTGALVATHTSATSADPSRMTDFRLRLLSKDSASGLYGAGPTSTLLTPGIAKSVSWFNPNNVSANPSYSGLLWEMEAIEVVARPRPARRQSVLETPEKNVFLQQSVDEADFRAWLRSQNLALIVTRNVTRRDAADIQQPFNLQVPGGAKTTSATRQGAIYSLSNFQIFQADQVRAYTKFHAGRRSLPQPLHDPNAINPPNPAGPVGSVAIAADGSAAALVPARRAVTWQTTDAEGIPIVRERVWVTFQPGEIRVCASCHGLNSRDQAGGSTPTNEPEALRQLLQYWKVNSQVGR
ncbi:MAG: hypothetical protein KF788_04955 [Piscinibacter sp.]|nr:hypothetical protein [Piscinibacter sp.]